MYYTFQVPRAVPGPPGVSQRIGPRRGQHHLQHQLLRTARPVQPDRLRGRAQAHHRLPGLVRPPHIRQRGLPAIDERFVCIETCL